MVSHLIHLWLILITFMVGITFIVDFYYINFMVVIIFMGDTDVNEHVMKVKACLNH